MFNHIVLFKLKDFGDEAQKSLARSQIAGSLRALKGKIPELKYLEAGENFELTGTSFDISLVTRFDSMEGFEAYRDHPEHLKVVELVRANTADRAVVDYLD